MNDYFDSFVLPLPQDQVERYTELAEMAAQIWMDHGALEYKECIADDVKSGKVTSFPQSVNLKENEVVIFAYARYKNREHRDEVMQKVFSDPRMKEMESQSVPFDGTRMFWGGFKTIVSRDLKTN